jgi:flavodoxin
MKTAIIYYSYEGNCALVAKTAGDFLGADVFEIKTEDDKKRAGFSKYLWGGGQALMKKKPAVLPVGADVNAYDLIILGTPVWAGAPAPAVVSFLDGAGITGKKLALFCCHGGGKRRALEKLRGLLPGNTFAGEIDFKNPARDDGDGLKRKIHEWVKTLGV